MAARSVTPSTTERQKQVHSLTVPPATLVVARSPDRATHRGPKFSLLRAGARPKVSCPSFCDLAPSTITAMEAYRISSDASVYYLTYSVVEWLPIFVTEATCKIVCDSLCFCHQKKTSSHQCLCDYANAYARDCIRCRFQFRTIGAHARRFSQIHRPAKIGRASCR